jgi:hypothetical protein
MGCPCPWLLRRHSQESVVVSAFLGAAHPDISFLRDTDAFFAAAVKKWVASLDAWCHVVWVRVLAEEWGGDTAPRHSLP